MFSFCEIFSGKNPVLPGEVSTIEIPRAQPDLGISIVGGCDTPLVSTVKSLLNAHALINANPPYNLDSKNDDFLDISQQNTSL